MLSMVDTRMRISASALILTGITLGAALAAQDCDPAKAFIESLEGKQIPTKCSTVFSSARTKDDPPQRLIGHLEGKYKRPSTAAEPDFDAHPARDFLDRLAGRTLWMIRRPFTLQTLPGGRDGVCSMASPSGAPECSGAIATER